MYEFLDKFFIIFHTVLILFNLFGWIWKKTRLINLVMLLLVAFSWLILGIWYGLGYCPLTHWHWLVRVEMGDYSMPYSYIKFLIDEITGLDADAVLVDYLTAIMFASALLTSVAVNIVNWKRKKIT